MRPMRLSRRPEPFDCDQFNYELKIDAFRALAHIEAGKGELISRKGNTFHGFANLATWIAVCSEKRGQRRTIWRNDGMRQASPFIMNRRSVEFARQGGGALLE